MNKLKQLIERYFKAIGYPVVCLDIEIDLLKRKIATTKNKIVVAILKIICYN